MEGGRRWREDTTDPSGSSPSEENGKDRDVILNLRSLFDERCTMGEDRCMDENGDVHVAARR
jgi:hypothetical protein